ncbi:hypothetical protein F4780DRAFT_778740 [Xylariomycetidae sp. FL0641]|nr:hypothetical protein F4780DRAFT_778740 [Xylariomycetidae sp. FL0641]
MAETTWEKYGFTRDQWDQLCSVETLVLIDDSPRMQESPGCWDEVKVAVGDIAEPLVHARPVDFGMCFLSDAALNKRKFKSPDEAIRLLPQAKRDGSTSLGNWIGTRMLSYWMVYDMNPKTTKPFNIICITDGQADDQKALKKAIGHSAFCFLDRKLQRKQVGIVFLQIGDPKQEAARKAKDFLGELDDGPRQLLLDHLEERLETASEDSKDQLKKKVDDVRKMEEKDLAVCDIVDTVAKKWGQHLTGGKLRKALLGAMDQTLDAEDSDADDGPSKE